jgi:hypothetical protein
MIVCMSFGISTGALDVNGGYRTTVVVEMR